VDRGPTRHGHAHGVLPARRGRRYRDLVRRRGEGEGRPPGTRRVDENGWIIDDAEDGEAPFGWPEILAHWHLVEADFHREYQIDLTEPAVLAKPARWFTARLFGLSLTSRLWTSLRPKPEQDDSTDDIDKQLGVTRE